MIEDSTALSCNPFFTTESKGQKKTINKKQNKSETVDQIGNNTVLCFSFFSMDLQKDRALVVLCHPINYSAVHVCGGARVNMINAPMVK